MTEKSILKVIRNCMPKMRLSRQKTLAALTEGCLKNPRGKLTEIARGMGGRVQLRDRLKRISRFIGNQDVNLEESSEGLLRWLICRQGPLFPVVVLMDWTKEHGQNVLMLSLKWGQRSIPFYWVGVRDGEFKGVQTKQEALAMSLLRRWLEEREIIVIADRGFSRASLYVQLKELKIDYIIRIPQHTYLIHSEYRGKLGGVRLKRESVRDFNGARLGKSANLEMRVIMKQAQVKGQWTRWCLATSLKTENKERIIGYYERRMGIEATFKDLKTTLGWRQQSSIERADRLVRYLLILVMSLICGLIVAERKGVNRIKYLVSLNKAWRGTQPVSFVQLGIWLIQNTAAQFSMIHPRRSLSYAW